jgi:hypothetical protein
MAALDVAKRRSLSLLVISRATASQAPFSCRALSGGGSGGDGASPAAPPPTPEAQPPSSSLARELRGWLRFMSPFSRYSATFYRTDSGVADRVVEMALTGAQQSGVGGIGGGGSGGGGNGSETGAVLVDLGCGDGQILRAALRAARSGRFAVRRVVGHELCPQLAAEARRRCADEQQEQGAAGAAAAAAGAAPLRVEVVEGDAGDADLSEADAVFLYMSPRANAQLLGAGPAAAAGAATAAKTTRSSRTLRSGAVVASLGFPVEGWDAWLRQQRAVESRGGSVPVYVYVAGGRR